MSAHALHDEAGGRARSRHVVQVGAASGARGRDRRAGAVAMPGTERKHLLVPRPDRQHGGRRPRVPGRLAVLADLNVTRASTHLLLIAI